MVVYYRMDRIVECVPNFSTSDPVVIDQIARAINECQGVELLHIDPDRDYNRTVFTFIGTPETIGEAAFAAISKATELVDMTQHVGQHPRIGTTDVCPYVPLKNVDEQECVLLANRLGERVATELHIPVYLYGLAARKSDRRALFNIRQGEYEGLEQKLQDPNWKPDFGPAVFSKKAGAVVIGVRNILIAYNVSLDTSELEIAKTVAERVRESGRLEKGQRLRGRFDGIQALGVTLTRDGRSSCQVSTNILDSTKTGIDQIFDGIVEEATLVGVRVTESELIGLIPLAAVESASQRLAPEITDINDKIGKVQSHLKLREVLSDRILDFKIGRANNTQLNP